MGFDAEEAEVSARPYDQVESKTGAAATEQLNQMQQMFELEKEER
jgi:hypothetical protein